RWLWAPLVLATRRRARSTPFPYTTLFRSPAPLAVPPQPAVRAQPVATLPQAALAELPAAPLAQAATQALQAPPALQDATAAALPDRKSTRLNSSHVKISYAVFCLKKKK